MFFVSILDINCIANRHPEFFFESLIHPLLRLSSWIWRLLAWQWLQWATGCEKTNDFVVYLSSWPSICCTFMISIMNWPATSRAYESWKDLYLCSFCSIPYVVWNLAKLWRTLSILGSSQHQNFSESCILDWYLVFFAGMVHGKTWTNMLEVLCIQVDMWVSLFHCLL